MSARLPLFALAVGAFCIGVTEFTPMGLLPVIAKGVGVSIPQAGILVSAYATGVLLGAPLMTLALARLPKRQALVLLMGIFAIGNLASAMAPGYLTLMAARVLTSLSHGAFFGLGSIVAASMVTPARQSSAVATMFLGLTIANIGGVPAATWLGATIGWRMAFGVTAVLGVIAMTVLWSALPQGSPGRMPDVRAELKVLIRPAVLGALGTTVLGAGAMFALYTYITPFLQQHLNASAGFVTAMLMLIGVGFSIGAVVGGKLADRSLVGALISMLLALGVVMLALPALAGSQLGAGIGMVLWGAAGFAINPALQMRVMRSATEAPGLASSVNIGAFNLGNALGAAAGGAAISTHWGATAASWAGAIMALLGVGLVVLQYALTPRPRASVHG